MRKAGYEGQGVRVGVISNGVSNYSNLRRAGILPPGLVVLDAKMARGDEGDWLLQVVHYIAPRAKLAFCPANEYEVAKVAACVKKLINDFHANLIASDVGRPTTDFTYSNVASELGKIHHNHPDVLLFSASKNYAGNFYRGKWTPVKWSLNGKRLLAQDFGKTTGRASSPYNVFRIEKGYTGLQIRGYVQAMKATSSCSKLPVRLVLMNPQNHVIASARPDDGKEGKCGQIRLYLVAKGRYSNTTTFPALEKEMVYHLALFGPRSIKRKNFRIRLQGLAYSRLKKAPSEVWLDVFWWRYATTGTAGGLAGPADETGDFAIAPLNPYTEFHGRYSRELLAGGGPACYLPNERSNRGSVSLSCYHQPMLAAPDLTGVAMPADNKKGYHFIPFLGSSAAAPVAAGAAALLLSAGVPAQRIPKLFERTAVRLGNQHGWNPLYGYGQLDVDAAARAARVLPKHDKVKSNPERPIATAAGTGAPPAESSYSPAQPPERLMQAAQSGSPKAMWELGNEFEQGKRYHKSAWGAALVWWQRAAKRKYPFAFCSLGNGYAYKKNKYWARGWAFPLPYRPRLALALLQTCARLGGGTSHSQVLIKQLRTHLSAQEVAESKVFTDKLMKNPAKYLPSLKYEYVPPSPK
jgi:hypothetical protein